MKKPINITYPFPKYSCQSGDITPTYDSSSGMLAGLSDPYIRIYECCPVLEYCKPRNPCSGGQHGIQRKTFPQSRSDYNIQACIHTQVIWVQSVGVQGGLGTHLLVLYNLKMRCRGQDTLPFVLLKGLFSDSLE